MDKVKYDLAKIIETMTQELMGYWHKTTDIVAEIEKQLDAPVESTTLKTIEDE